MKNVQYPYLPLDRTLSYVPKDNAFILLAKEYARKYSLDKTLPAAAVVVKDGEVIGWGANGSSYHTKYGCERVRQGCGSGRGYELCEGCHPKNHAEQCAIRDVQNTEFFTEGADLYVWGLWWCCESCWDVIIKAGIKDVYMMEDSEALFCKEHPDNIIGRQFEE